MKISELEKQLAEIKSRLGDIDTTINGADIANISIEKNMFNQYYVDFQSLPDDLSGSYTAKTGYY